MPYSSTREFYDELSCHLTNSQIHLNHSYPPEGLHTDSVLEFTTYGKKNEKKSIVGLVVSSFIETIDK